MWTTFGGPSPGVVGESLPRRPSGGLPQELVVTVRALVPVTIP
jgi:hypothetical protein